MKKYGGKLIVWVLGVGGMLLPTIVFGGTMLGNASTTVELGNHLLGQGFRVTNISNLSVGTSTVSGAVNVAGDVNISGSVLRVDSTNVRVGIGTPTPDQKLAVSGGNIILDNNYGIYGRYASGTVGRPLLYTVNNQYTILRSIDNDAGDGIAFKSYAGADLMTIVDIGKVGIGTTVPDTILETRKASAQYWNGAAAGTWNNSLTPSSAITVTNSAVGGYDPVLLFRGATSAGTIKTIGAIGFLGTGSWADATASTQTSDMYFISRDSNNTLQERMRITSAGKVGIGTPIPDQKLAVSGGNIILDNNYGIYGRYASGTVGRPLLYTVNSQYTILRSIDNDAGDGIAFKSYAGADLMTIVDIGKVGIGTTAPATKLESQSADSSYWGGALWSGSATPASALTITQASLGGYDPVLLFRQKTNNGAGGGTIKTTGAIGFLGANSWSDATTSTQVSDMYFVSRDSSGALQERMRITSAGKVGIGTTAPNHTLDIVGAYYSRQFNKGSSAGAVAVNWNDGNMQHITLTGNATLTFANGQGGARYVLALKQGTGGQTVTWPATVRWPGGTVFTLTAGANKTDYIGFIYNNVDQTYDAVAFSANF